VVSLPSPAGSAAKLGHTVLVVGFGEPVRLGRYHPGMGDSGTGKARPRVSTEELLEGLEITPDGRARARRKLDEAGKRLTRERLDAMRAQVGLPPKSQAADEGRSCCVPHKIKPPVLTSTELSTYTRNMTVHPEVFDAALTLPQAERAELAHQLLVSLDEPADDPAVVAAEWASEIERRVAGIAAGDTEGISWDEVRKQFER
jgi:putative addiction module component (TIGR02574 family)